MVESLTSSTSRTLSDDFHSTETALERRYACYDEFQWWHSVSKPFCLLVTARTKYRTNLYTFVLIFIFFKFHFAMLKK